MYFIPSSSTATLPELDEPPNWLCQASRTLCGSLIVPGCSSTPLGAAPFAKNLLPYSPVAIARPMAFFAMAIGLAVGTGYVVYAALFTVIIGLIIVVLSLLNFGDNSDIEKKLTIVVPEDLDYSEIFDDIFDKYTKSHYLQKTKTTNMGSLFELTYRVVLKDDVNEKRMIDKIRVKNSNLKVVLSQPMNEEEL